MLVEISNISWPRTLQAAAAVFSYYNGTSLTPNGCYLAENLEGDRNCTLACQNLTKVFGSADTFQNCLSYPTVHQLLTFPNATHGDQDLASTYGIGRSHIDAPSDTVKNTIKCLAGYCNSSKTCTQFFIDRFPFVSSSKLATFPLVKEDVYHAYLSDSTGGTLGTILGICKAVQRTAAVNADISGVGIYVAYFMQAGISIIAWLLLKLWGSGLYFGSLIYALNQYDYDTAYEKAQATYDKWVSQKDKIVEGLIEFHKAQCFFMLAIQAASLIAKHGTLLDRSSLQQIHNDYTFINALSGGGHLPITFVLYTIRTAGHKSWYLFILSAFTVALSAAALLTVDYPEPRVTSNDYHYADCGNVNPIALCLETDFSLPTSQVLFDEQLHPSDPANYQPPDPGIFQAPIGPSSLRIGTSIATLVYSLVVLGALLFESLKFEITSHPPSHGTREALTSGRKIGYALMQKTKQFSVHLSRKARYLCSGLPSLVISVGYIAFFFNYLIGLNYFQHPTDDFPSGYIPINLSQWTFGQIAAITIWIQPLVQYAYLEICGMQGRRWHLPKDYEVVATKEKAVPIVRPRRRSMPW